MKRIFVTGIDTDTGKTYATAHYANQLKAKGLKVITFKLVQTGCIGISEDIIMHRKLMNEPLLDIDKDGTTCPYVFKFPASPHLAAELENRSIDLKVIEASLSKIEALNQFDICLIEGAGGLMVPIHSNYLISDYIKENNLPTILVTSGKLGSINHTLMSLEIIKQKDILLKNILFNDFITENEVISNDTKQLIKNIIFSDFIGVKFSVIPFTPN